MVDLFDTKRIIVEAIAPPKFKYVFRPEIPMLDNTRRGRLLLGLQLWPLNTALTQFVVRQLIKLTRPHRAIVVFFEFLRKFIL